MGDGRGEFGGGGDVCMWEGGKEVRGVHKWRHRFFSKALSQTGGVIGNCYLRFFQTGARNFRDADERLFSSAWMLLSSVWGPSTQVGNKAAPGFCSTAHYMTLFLSVLNPPLQNAANSQLAVLSAEQTADK